MPVIVSELVGILLGDDVPVPSLQVIEALTVSELQIKDRIRTSLTVVAHK
jgi:hypothetical protein